MYAIRSYYDDTVGKGEAQADLEAAAERAVEAVASSGYLRGNSYNFV